MKPTLALLGALALTAAGSFGFEIPRGTYNIDELDQARSKAAERPEPVVFLVSRKSLEPT